MDDLSLEEIKSRALAYQDSGVKWHFHILTPTCSLNQGSRYAFILECPEKDESYVYYSDKAEKELGQELSPLLHGDKILNQATTSAEYKPSATIKQIVASAKALNSQNIEWHHHVLFPGCRFNTHSPQFTLILEGPTAAQKLESLSNLEPTDDLKQIESLFYKK